MENTSTQTELDGCMCEYIKDELRKQIDALVEKTDVYPSQVVNVALQIGLAVLIGQCSEILRGQDATGGRGKVMQRKGKLSGKGI